MQKLRAIHSALLSLVEELEEEKAIFNLATEKIIIKATGFLLSQNAGQSLPERIRIIPRISLAVRSDSIVAGGELLAPALFGRKDLIVKTFSNLQFMLDGPSDEAVRARLRGVYKEMQEMRDSGGQHEGWDDFFTIKEFRFFLYLLRAEIS